MPMGSGSAPQCKALQGRCTALRVQVCTALSVGVHCQVHLEKVKQGAACVHKWAPATPRGHTRAHAGPSMCKHSHGPWPRAPPHVRAWGQAHPSGMHWACMAALAHLATQVGPQTNPTLACGVWACLGLPHGGRARGQACPPQPSPDQQHPSALCPCPTTRVQRAAWAAWGAQGGTAWGWCVFGVGHAWAGGWPLVGRGRLVWVQGTTGAHLSGHVPTCHGHHWWIFHSFGNMQCALGGAAQMWPHCMACWIHLVAVHGVKPAPIVLF